MAPLGPFHEARRVAVAVSGGADSTALAWLLSRWGRPEALIVDHGLRPGSAAEAALAERRLATVGVPSRVITLRGVRPGMQAAREARYAALFSACAEDGLVDLLVAHHAGDQAETVLLREGARSGPSGLAGMAAVTVRGPVRMLRPLLGMQPGRLRDTLRAAGLDWTEDPGNHDPTTPRGRLRAGDGQAEALARAAAAGRAREVAERSVAAELAACAAIDPDGVAHVRGELSAPALSALVWTLSGRPHPPRPDAVARLIPLRAGTLHGVQVLPAGRLGAGWLLAREPGAMAPPVPADAGARWDGRFRLRTAHPGQELGPALMPVGARRWPACIEKTRPSLADTVFDPDRPAAPAAFVSS